MNEWDWLNDGLDEFVADSAKLDKAHRENRIGEYISSQSAAIRLEAGESKAVVGD